jgi:hypothetical protein
MHDDLMPQKGNIVSTDPIWSRLPADTANTPGKTLDKHTRWTQMQQLLQRCASTKLQPKMSACTM